MAVGFNRSVWDGTAPMVAPTPGARTIGDLAIVDTGCVLWSKSRRDHREEAIGGIVLAVFDKVDTETGEIERTFSVLDYSRPELRVRELAESDVDLECAEGPDQGRLRKVVRRCALEVAQSKGPLTSRELDRVRWQYSLAGVVVPAS